MPREVVVVGAGLGGLSAAIYARLSGHHVLVLEQSTGTGGKAASISNKGYRLDPGPSIIILTKIYEAVFRAAGRRMEDYLTFERLDPISRVCFEGDSALDLPADRSDCDSLLRSVAPQDAQAFARLMTKLDAIAPNIDKSVFAHPYEKPWQLADPHLISVALQFDVRLTYRELVDSMFSSPLLRSFFYGFPSYGGQTYDSKAPGALMIPYLMIQEGVYYPKGGVGAIPRAFESLARELGVEFRFDERVAGFEIEKSKLTAVRLESGERVLADAVISNVDRLTTQAWMGRVTKVQPSFSYFTVHWGLPRKIEGLSHHTLLVPKSFEHGFEALYRERVFPDPPIVYLNETSGIDPSVAPNGATNLFAVVTTPAMEDHLDWERNREEYVEAIHATVQKFGFRFDRSEVDFERVQSPAYFAAAHGNYRGSLYGPDEKHRLFGGLFPLSNRDDHVRNLFYCGGSVQPGAGLPMVTLSGKFAAGLL